MRLPSDNPEGYRQTSVIEAAGQLHGHLLLTHGTMDDNVHMQNTLQLAHALQQAGKSFDLMVYPNSRHGIRDQAQIFHLYSLKTRFLRENL
jgi:dipeptidyl-peptidase-4